MTRTLEYHINKVRGSPHTQHNIRIFKQTGAIEAYLPARGSATRHAWVYTIERSRILSSCVYRDAMLYGDSRQGK